MSRKPAPPKPEELVAKLDEKFETFKDEIVKSVEERNEEIKVLQEKDSELSNSVKDCSNKNILAIEEVKTNLGVILDEKLKSIRR